MTDASRAELVDSQMWISWLEAVDSNQTARAKFLRARFSAPLQAAQTQWLGGVKVDADGKPSVVPAGTPMNLAAYVVPQRTEADRIAAVAEARLGEATAASANSTRFVVLAVVLAVVLLFAGIATKFSNPKVQVGLLVGSILLLAFCFYRLVTLPELLR
jgi:hypothetical protein